MRTPHVLTHRLRYHLFYCFMVLMAPTVSLMAQTQDAALQKIKVLPLPIYPSGDDVKISYTVSNGTQGDLKLVVMPAISSIKITLEGPNGKRITPYPYYPFAPGSFKFAVLKPGENKVLEIDLSNYFPFTEAGNYRCVLTRRVFTNDDTPVPNAPEALRGTPVDLISEPFQVRVESPTTSKLRPLHDTRTGLMPDDHLDGTNTEQQWYDRSVSTSTPGRPDDSSSVIVANSTPSASADRKEPQVAPSTIATAEVAAKRGIEAFRPWWLALIFASVVLMWLALRKRK